MILKGSQRSGGQNLAAHLSNIHDNEHVRLHELRGFASDDLRGAFKEAEAISLGTKCRQYLWRVCVSVVMELSPSKGTGPFRCMGANCRRRLEPDIKRRAHARRLRGGAAQAEGAEASRVEVRRRRRMIPSHIPECVQVTVEETDRTDAGNRQAPCVSALRAA